MVWTAEEITVLLLLLLPDPAAPHYVPSPCYNFTITPKPRPGQSWCEVQRQFTRYTFYTCSSQKVEPISPLGMMSSATASWNQQDEHWKELMEELRKALLDNQHNIYKAFNPLSLQGSMTCQQESNGHPRAFWEFGFYGQICLSFHSKDRHWTELKLKCRPLKEALDSARDLLLMISAGDCGNCVKESETLDTKAAPATAPGTAQSKATTNRPVTSIIPVILACLIIGCVLLQ